jgi:hypothetical protein
VRAGDALGLSKADRLKLRDVGQGEFYAFGPALGQPGVVHFRSDQVRTTHPRPGQRHLLTAPALSRAIRGVPAKFADLPHEVEVEIRGLDGRVGESLNWSAKSNTTRARVQRSRPITWPSSVPLSLLLSGSAPRGSGNRSRAACVFAK